MTKDAGIKDKISTHTLRRTFATNLYIEGVDLKRISRRMGHKSVKTTEKYI